MTCAKRRVVCTIISPSVARKAESHVPLTVVGENYCKNPQLVCPREPNEDYTKCHTICKQVGHAEIVAAEKAARYAPHFVGGVAFIEGHEYACTDCEAALAKIGITHIRFGTARL
jgi:hypothetical protein